VDSQKTTVLAPICPAIVPAPDSNDNVEPRGTQKSRLNTPKATRLAAALSIRRGFRLELHRVTNARRVTGEQLGPEANGSSK